METKEREEIRQIVRLELWEFFREVRGAVTEPQFAGLIDRIIQTAQRRGSTKQSS